MGSTTEYTRLHITPLSASLLPSILPPSVLPNARNISYHSVQTFPDKPYGFLDLPTMDASKLKTKLNGSILKGQKIRIESAKPKLEFIPEDPEPERPKREKKKRKRDEIPGADIGERSVKRGWTEPATTKKKDKERKVKSKYSTGKECLFKTVLPANVAAHSKVEKKEKKRKGRSREVVIHEFEKTTKYPTFLKSSALDGKKKGVREFVEGKGWVDEDGEVVEAVVAKSRPRKLEAKSNLSQETKKKESSPESSSAKSQSVTEIPPEVLEETSSFGSSSSEESEVEDEALTAEPKVKTSTLQSIKEASPRASPSVSTSSSESEDNGQSSNPLSAVSTPIKSSRPASSSGLTIKIPSPTTITTSVHPLEALYKRRKATSASNEPAPDTAAESFTFFGADADEPEGDGVGNGAEDRVPLTPFTQRDFEYRGLRSAAPTPDTGFGNKRFLWPNPSDNEDEADDQSDSPVRQSQAKGSGKGAKEEKSGDGEGKGGEETEFQKWFYEHRGDTNRAWKKRRREVAKEKRQRENRKRGNK